MKFKFLIACQFFCALLWEVSSQSDDDVCGKADQISLRIIGGDEVDRGEFPW